MFAREHLERLAEGAKALDMDLGASLGQIQDMVYKLVGCVTPLRGISVCSQCVIWACHTGYLVGSLCALGSKGSSCSHPCPPAHLLTCAPLLFSPGLWTPTG